jgi:hypothetical protein
MSESDHSTDVLDVFRIDPATGTEVIVGSVGVLANGKLEVVQTFPEAVEDLLAAVDAVNGKSRLVELVPYTGPTEAGDIAAEVIERTDPRFIAAASRYMALYYGIRLG